MVQQTIIAVVMGVVLFTTTLIASEQCNDGYINQHLCQKTCNFTHCSCIMTETTPFTSCTQTCNFLSSCPQMVCSGKLNFLLLYCRKDMKGNLTCNRSTLNYNSWKYSLHPIVLEVQTKVPAGVEENGERK